jgi:hypothetical protein
MRTYTVARKAVKCRIDESVYKNKIKLGKALDYAFRKREEVNWETFDKRMSRYYSVVNKKDESTAADICYLMVQVGQDLE